MAKIKKDAADVLDYRVLWADDPTWVVGDTITDSTFTVTDPTDPDLTVDSESFTDTTATVWLSDGANDIIYTVVNHVVTAAGRELDKQFYIVITDKAR